MAARVYDILDRKGRDVLTTEPETTVFDAIAHMVDRNVGSIVIVGEGEIEGIFTERDYLRRIVLRGRTSRETAIEEVMTADVIAVTPEYSIDDCLALMTQEKCRHLPVLEDGVLAGIVSIGDCVKQQNQHAQSRLQNLTEYVKGRYPG